MIITTFKNMKGLIHGSDPRRIACDREGVLKIGGSEVEIKNDSVMPTLFNGATGIYAATFVDKEGQLYDLGKVEIRGGRVQPPSDVAVEFMELRASIELLTAKSEALWKKISELEGIFDTNALNFLIK